MPGCRARLPRRAGPRCAPRARCASPAGAPARASASGWPGRAQARARGSCGRASRRRARRRRRNRCRVPAPRLRRPSTPATVSWSVSAMSFTPQAATCATSAAGSSMPSDAVECRCRSTGEGSFIRRAGRGRRCPRDRRSGRRSRVRERSRRRCSRRRRCGARRAADRSLRTMRSRWIATVPSSICTLALLQVSCATRLAISRAARLECQNSPSRARAATESSSSQVIAAARASPYRRRQNPRSSG